MKIGKTKSTTGTNPLAENTTMKATSWSSMTLNEPITPPSPATSPALSSNFFPCCSDLSTFGTLGPVANVAPDIVIMTQPWAVRWKSRCGKNLKKKKKKKTLEIIRWRWSKRATSELKTHTITKNSDKKKKSSEAQIVEPWYNENFATDGTWGGEGSLQTHQTNKQASKHGEASNAKTKLTAGRCAGIHVAVVQAA